MNKSREDRFARRSVTGLPGASQRVAGHFLALLARQLPRGCRGLCAVATWANPELHQSSGVGRQGLCLLLGDP